MKNYNIQTIDGIRVIWYEENGRRVSFVEAEDNSDYQAYLRFLNGEDEQSGTL